MVAVDFVSLAVLVGSALLLAWVGLTPWRLVGRGFRAIGARTWLSVSTVVVVALVVNGAVALRHGVPIPIVTDEFAYLLGADTFSKGRLTNPAHPFWKHFESPGVIHKPTYQSKYPPGQSAALALGMLATGEPIAGAWISLAIACGALSWMLRPWVRPRWALAGGLLAAVSPGLVDGWGQSYMGGGVAMLGGALLFGSLRRLAEAPRSLDACLFSIGLVVLANSRPFEGLLAALMAAAAAGFTLLRRGGPGLKLVIRKLAFPALLVLALGGLSMAHYNYRVTRNPFELPYQVWYRTYKGGGSSLAGMALFRQPATPPTRVVPGMRPGGVEVEDPEAWERTLEVKKQQRLAFNAAFYLPGVIALSLAGLPFALRDRWLLFAAATVGVVLWAVFRGQTIWAPHYSAPVAPLVFAIVVASLRRLHAWHFKQRRIGRWLIGAVAVAFVVGSIAELWRTKAMIPARAYALDRQRITAELLARPGKHLVIVRYDRKRVAPWEWVHNGATINASRIIWAREIGGELNRKLLRRYRDRTAWLLDAQLPPPVPLRPYPPPAP